VAWTLHQVEQHDGVGDHSVDQHRQADERGQIELAAGHGQGDEDADDGQRQRETVRRTTHYCKRASKRSLDWAMAPLRGAAMI
jgi:hypothetical protein